MRCLRCTARGAVVAVVLLAMLSTATAAAPQVLLPTAAEKAVPWRYTTAKPADGWQRPDFDDSGWKQGPAGFGTRGTPGAAVGTKWDTHDVWIRTAFDYDGAEFKKAAVRIHHDEDATVYLNGTAILTITGWTTDYEMLDATDSVRKALRKGRNVVAATCHQTYGGQYVDVGLVLDPEGDVQPVLPMPPLPPIKPLFDYPVRDTSVCVGGDGNYYLTGTTGFPTWWKTNEGIRVWRSADLKKWEPLGLVWKIDDGTWQKQVHGDRRALWAPDIHFLKGTFWLTHCMNFGGTGLLKSTTGKAEGPYVDVHPQGPITGNIDASLFEDDDGKVYFVWQNGLVARMNDEMTDLAEKPRLLKPASYKHVGFEGAYLTRKDGRYYLICADFIQGQYHCMVASSDKVYGPYGPRYVAIPHGGHNMFFTDKAGNWWATFFGNDAKAPFRERPAMLRIELDDQRRVRPNARSNGRAGGRTGGSFLPSPVCGRGVRGEGFQAPAHCHPSGHISGREMGPWQLHGECHGRMMRGDYENEFRRKARSTISRKVERDARPCGCPHPQPLSRGRERGVAVALSPRMGRGPFGARNPYRLICLTAPKAPYYTSRILSCRFSRATPGPCGLRAAGGVFFFSAVGERRVVLPRLSVDGAPSRFGGPWYVGFMHHSRRRRGTMADREYPSLLVTGDFGPDCNVYLPALDGRPSPDVPRTRFSRSLGGAALVHGLLSEVAEQIKLAGAGLPDVRFFTDPGEGAPTCQPVAGLWLPKDGGPLLAPQKTKVWRLDRSIGLGEAIGVKDLPKESLPARCGADFRPNILVVEDDAGKFRFRLAPSRWPDVLAQEGDLPSWIVLKMTEPVCQGDLWWHLARKGGPADRLVVVLPVSDLRKEDVRISLGISWERTVEDLVRELSQSPVLAGLEQARHVVVVLNEEGAVWASRTADGKREFRLIFDPRNMELQWQQRAGINGGAYGFLSSFVAALAARMALSANWQAEPEIERGIEDGLRAVRLLRLLGHGNVDADEPGFPFKAVAGQIVGAALPDAKKKPEQTVDPEKLGYFGRAAIPVPVPESGSPPGKGPALKEKAGSWRLLYSADAEVPRPADEPLYGVARRVAFLGLKELRNAPFASFGRFLTADRAEIEALYNIRCLVEDYRNGADEKKPLSIAVFGPPGAGKSFAIEEIASGVLDKKTPFLVFNLSQFADVSDLIGAFHQVRDKVLEGKMPVVFWDEFDSGSYKWLQYLLAPMQDGRFQEGQVTHAIGRCVFVFAGATSYDMENFGPCPDNEKACEDFRLLKGPDFVSRLHGFLNVLGPNRRQICQWKKLDGDLHRREWSDDAADVCFPVRRALLLRAKLGLVEDRADERMDIDHGVLAALLEVDRYTHGARSMGKIIHSLRQAKDFSLRRSGLPTDEVLRMNTDRDQFLRLASGTQDFQKQAQYLAPVIHEFYRELGKKKGWKSDYDMPFDELPEHIKMDNVAAANRIPWILSLAGLYLVEGKPDSDQETVVVRRVIDLHLDTLAEEEHVLWEEFRRKNGWTCEKARNNEEKIHPSLKPFDELTEEDRKKDENAVRSFPEIATRAGFRIVPRRPG